LLLVRAQRPVRLTGGASEHLMLQRNMLQPEGPRGLSGRATQNDRPQEGDISDTIHSVLGFVRRQYPVIIVAVSFVLTMSIVYLRVTPPTYTAQVQILLGSPRAQFVQQQSLIADPALDLGQIETQLQIIKSRAIAVAVIDQLKLNDDPDLSAPTYSRSALLDRLRSWIGLPAQASDLEASQPSDAAIAAFQNRLTAARADFSNVIEIGYSSSNAVRAAQVANAVANAYLTDQRKAKVDANRDATNWLHDRLRDLGDQALEAERAVSEYRSKNNIVTSGGKPLDDQQITDLNSRLVAAGSATADASARVKRYQAILNANSTDSPLIGTLDAAGSDSVNGPIITNLRTQYLELVRREREWSARFGHDHVAVVNLRAKMRDIRTSILDEVRRLAEASRSEFEIARQRQQEIENQLNNAVSQSRSTNTAELTIRDLESRATELRNMYGTFLQRYMGSVQQESFPASETRVIYPAATPQSKSKPKTPSVLALGVFGGLALGIGLGLLRELMDRVFRTSAQIESVLELPCLSMVPLMGAAKPDKAAASPDEADDELRRRIVSSRPGVHNAIVNMPLSRFAEAVRSVKLAIDLNSGNAANQVVGFTSSLPNEGKTTIAASLGQLIAHSGKKVIIVDCDLRNPSLSATLAPNAEKGIIEVINGDCSLEDTVWQDSKTNLVFLPVVRRGPLLHTSEILSTEAMRALFNRLRASYDYVIVDLPPLAPVVDVRATTPLIDCFVLVVEWGRTKIDVVRHALHTAPNLYENLVGVVLNKTDIKSMARYDSHHSDYYSGSHYARYGFSDVDLKAR
jgi:succinoglycan biosynthesis transport protein ExoP